MRFLGLLFPILVACSGPRAAPLPAPPATASITASTPVIASAVPTPVAPPITAARHFTPHSIPLSGATGSVSLDYLAVDRSSGRVWIPAGETGSVDVLDAGTDKLTRIEGFPTATREMHGKTRSLGPSSATLGEGFAYIGNRANSEVCAVDLAKMVRGDCVTLPTSPDGLQYVRKTKEVWVTTPRDQSITILDASAPAKLKASAKIALLGDPEGYAIDDARGVFYTNLEDKDKTLAIDVHSRRVRSTWEPRCGAAGPRGLALDGARGFLFVACTNHLAVLDAAHDGALLSQLDTGDGVDNIDYLDKERTLYAVAGKAAALTVATVDDKGALSLSATIPTSPGTRVVVVGNDGTAYVADPARGQILAFGAAR